MRRLVHVAEVLNTAVIAVVVLLRRERVSLLPGPYVVHVHGQPVASTFDHVHDHRIVEALSQRQPDVVLVGIKPIVYLGLGHIWRWCNSRQSWPAEIRVGIGHTVIRCSDGIANVETVSTEWADIAAVIIRQCLSRFSQTYEFGR